MDLREYLRTLRRNWLLILAVTLIALTASGAYTLLQRPQYQASSSVFVSTRSASTAADLSSGSDFSRQVVTSFVTVARSPYVLTPVIRQLGLHESPSTLAGRISVSVPADSSVMQITASARGGVEAAKIANAVAGQLTRAVVDLTPNETGAASAVKVTQIQSAAAPSAPASPRPLLNLLLGGLAGLAVGLITATIRDRMDTRIRSLADVARVTDRPVLGLITFDRGAAARPLGTSGSVIGPFAEAFRSLRASLQFFSFGARRHVFVFTSSIEGEGKSTTVSDLAVIAAEARKRVLVIDADLRRPRIADYFGLDGSVGLTDVLIGDTTLAEAVQRWGEHGLDVLPAGQLPPNPSELLQAPECQELLDRVAEAYDLVLIDAPPLLPVADAGILAGRVGGAILLTALGRVQRPQLAAALEVLNRVGSGALGLVVTMVPRRGPDSMGYGQGAYSYVHPKQTPAPAGSGRSAQERSPSAVPREIQAGEG